MRRCILIACLALLLTVTPCMGASNAQPKPGCVCTAIYDPVCGSDGRDYSSACQADCAGVTVASHGMCRDANADSDTPTNSSSTVDPTRSGIQLPGGVSVNAPISDSGNSSPGCLCTNIAIPVCGEDGQTYTNDCQASCAGIQLASDGACQTQSPPVAARPAQPVAQEQRPTAAPAAAAASPGCVCTALYDPVCGADGKDYPSACNAGCAGVSVASKGLCEPTLPAPAPSPAGNASSAPAPAAPAQDACACPKIYAPVCTDKGVTRSNKCVAGCQNETVVSQGSCSKADEVPANGTTAASTPAATSSSPTDGTASVSNASAPALDKADDTMPAATKAAPNTATTSSAGACGSCGDLYSPVCGTDGVTYSNSCEAECLNRVQVAFEGVCGSRGAAPAPAAAANTTSSTAVRSSASGLRTGGAVFGGFAVAAVTLLSMLWL